MKRPALFEKYHVFLEVVGTARFQRFVGWSKKTTAES